MPLARIITRQASDAEPIRSYLAARGYEVEIADPAQLISTPADLEISLECMRTDEGLRRAAELAAAAGADVYVAPGALPRAEVEAVRRQRDDQVRAARVAAEQAAIAEQQALAREAQRVREEQEREVEATRLREQQQRDLEATRRRQEAEAERLRVEQQAREREAQLAREQREREAAARRFAEQQERERETARQAAEREEAERARAAAVARERAEQERVERKRQRARQQQVAPTVVLPMPVSRGSSVAADRVPAVDRRRGPTRRGAMLGPDTVDYWRGAFTGAAAAAVIVMLAWATLGNSHSTGVPTGSVAKPSGAPVAAATVPVSAPAVVPAKAAASPVPQSDAPSRSTPTPAVHHSRRHHASDSAIADDVVVRHFGTAKPAPPKATTQNGVKHISDQ